MRVDSVEAECVLCLGPVTLLCLCACYVPPRTCSLDMAGDEYFASKGSLKLKGVADSGIKKKKKKKKETEKEMAASIRRNTSPNSTPEKEASNVGVVRNYTEAERRFMERQRKMEADRILKKASKTHKEKVEDFNRHLDSLTEHFDIPKVSWTK